MRASTDRYYALQGTASNDGCLLRWEEEASRIASPCTYVVYDLHGNVVTGVTTAPLRRYAVFIRDATVFVTES